MELVIHPNPVLRVQASLVLRIGKKERRLFRRMLTNIRKNGLLARIAQHEIDHLNGVLIIDHGPDVLAASSERQEVTA